MLLRSTLAGLFILTIFSLSAQPPSDSQVVKKKFVNIKKIPKRPLCVNARSYSAEEISGMTPFANAAKVTLVSYFKIKRDKSTDQILSLIDENGKFEPTKWEEEIELNKAQQKALGNILFNYGNKKVPYMREAVECFMPNNAILFYDKDGKIASVIELSFACQNMLSIPQKMETGTWCAEKFDVMRKFFEDAGVKFYGMDD